MTAAHEVSAAREPIDIAEKFDLISPFLKRMTHVYHF